VIHEVFVRFANPALPRQGKRHEERSRRTLQISFRALPEVFYSLFTAAESCLSILISLPSMDTQPSDPEKSPRVHNDIEEIAVRGVTFPGDDDHHRDEKSRPTGVEMKRQMTQEEIHLAAAGYEHLTKDKPVDGNTKFGDVDITEHSRPIEEVESILGTSFNWADPAQSSGLSTAEAEERLKRDGPNALTPPKKKSALQKVCIHPGI
jgi:Cation transporter/ATPase, N-terminus